MRTRTILIGALLLASAGLAQAQEQQQPANGSAQTIATPASSFTPTLGQVDFGYRSDSTRGDFARYSRFRDLRDGAFLDRFRFDKETQASLFRAEANNVGYRDQRYFGEFRSIGKLNVSFEWNQVPLFYSEDTRSLYRHTGNGVLVIDDPIQQAIQNAGTAAAVRDPVIAAQLANAQRFDMKSRRDLANFNLVYTLNRDVDVKFSVKNSNRNGAQPYAFAFGTSPGANPVVEFAAPLDDRTTDVKGAVEFANAKGLFSVGYNGSWFDNQIPALRFDNPLRITDQLGGAGAAVGQAVWWPTNTAFSVNATGSYKLPRRSRANATISFGRWSQDESLYPPTLNTALLRPLPIPRTSADAKADIMSMVLGLSSRPVQNVWLNAKYRYYDYDNKTPHFGPVERFMGDTNFAGGTATQGALDENEPSSFKRQNLDLDASFSPVNYLALGIGYGREDADRTFRIFENTAEDTFRVTVDSTGNQYFTVRGKYEMASRSGSGFDRHLLDEVGEHAETRHFDIANRDRTRATLLLSVFPVSYLSLNASVGGGKDDYDETGFGLRDSDNTNWSAGFDVTPTDVVSFGMSYGYEKYTAYQYSRSAAPDPDPQFFDARRDWWIDSDDIVKTITASLDLIKAFPKTDIRLGYDFSDGKATYVYGLPANQTLFTATPLRQLTPVKNRITGGIFDLKYFVRANVALGVAYEYEEYKVDDFGLDTDTINRLDPRNPSGAYTSTIYSGYVFRPYTAHTVWMRMTYLW